MKARFSILSAILLAVSLCAAQTGNGTTSWTPVTGYSDIVGEDKTISLKLPVTVTKCFFRLRAWLQ